MLSWRVALEAPETRFGSIAHLLDSLTLHPASLESYASIFSVLSKYEYDSDVVFETADRNRDQLLSADELQAAIGPQPADAPTAPERMIAVDLDRDGQLDDAELRRALEMRFSWLDRNADGGLDFDEMKAGVGARVRP